MIPSNEVLQHHGVKGMHWGVRKNDSGSSATPVVSRAKPGKLVKTSGGANHPAHEDALRLAEARQKAKKSSVDSLSNKELQDLVLRMNLEQQYSKLVTSDPRSVSAGKKYLDQVLAAGKTANQVHSFLNSPAGKIAKAALKAKLGK